MSIKVKSDTRMRYTTVRKESYLCRRLQLRDRLVFETHDTWCGFFNTKSHRRKIQAIEKINHWMKWYIPKKLNCETWYCNGRDNNNILNKYKEWKYTILYVVKEEKGDEI